MSFFWENKEKKLLKTDLLSAEAEQKAKKLSEEGANVNKYTQIRKFYDETTAHKTFIISKPEDKHQEIFRQRLPYIKMMNAKLEYSHARNLIGRECLDLLKNCINEIKDLDDFYAFADFFEALMAFYKKYDVKKKGGR